MNSKQQKAEIWLKSGVSDAVRRFWIGDHRLGDWLDDLVSDTMIQFIDYGSESIDNPVAYAIEISKSIVKQNNYYQRLAVDDCFDLAIETVSAEQPIENHAQTIRDESMIVRAIELMSDAQRQAACLVMRHGSVAAAAKASGKTRQTIESTLKTAGVRVREAFSAWGVEYA